MSDLLFLGTGKSLIFSKIMGIYEVKRQYDLKMDREINSETEKVAEKNKNYRHAIVNEVCVLQSPVLYDHVLTVFFR